MKTFGPYQVVQEISHQRGTVVYKGRDATTEVAIKVYHLAHFADGDPNRVEELAQSFYRTVEMQKTMAEKSEYLMPVLVYGMQGEAAWEVSPIYPSSAQKLIASKTVPPREQFQKIIDSVLQGAMDLKDQQGRSHGNLKPSNVLITTDPKTRVTKVVLRDALPGDGAQSEKFEVADLNAIGRLMYLMALPSETRDPSVWNISETQPPSSWVQLFGNQAKAWAAVCNRLLDPNLAPHSYSLEKLALDLLKLKPAEARAAAGRSNMMPALAAAVVVLAAVGGFFAWKASQDKAPATVAKAPDTEALRATEEAARKASAEAARLAEEKRLAETRAAEQTKFSDDARLKAEAEAKRLAEEKQQLEARAARAREESRLQTEAVAFAQREAAEKEVELDRLRKERRNAEDAQARQLAVAEENARKAADLKRQLEEAQRRELAAELARGKKLAEFQRTVSPASANKSQPERSTAMRQPRKSEGWLNSIGMRFVPVSEEQILVCIWETRRKDFEEFLTSSRKTVDPNWKKTSFEQGALHPVVNITVGDAEAFCAWLTQNERSKGMLAKGQFYRLPTEREWMGFASESSRGTGYAWGNVWPPPSGIGNYGPTYSYDRFDFTAPAGQFKPSPSGIYDVAGNVWEMCLSGSSSWTARGGSWLTTSPDDLSLSQTVALRPTDRREDIGFRCVIDLGN